MAATSDTPTAATKPSAAGEVDHHEAAADEDRRLEAVAGADEVADMAAPVDAVVYLTPP
jgi:hypothetical protein